MKLYHGSKIKIENPIPNGSNPDNDYGPAFYLTRDLESAHEWACKNGSVGIVNKYDFRSDTLKVLDLTDKIQYSVLNWLAILLHFRTLNPGFVKSFKKRLEFIEKNYYIDVTQYDLVVGYRAEDAYFRFPIDFIRGNITLEDLEYAYTLGELGIQYVFMSEKAIKLLKFVESFPSDDKYIQQYFNRVVKATEDFDNIDKDKEGTRIFNLMKEEKK